MLCTKRTVSIAKRIKSIGIAIEMDIVLKSQTALGSHGIARKKRILYCFSCCNHTPVKEEKLKNVLQQNNISNGKKGTERTEKKRYKQR